jgi:hypothetical protein
VQGQANIAARRRNNRSAAVNNTVHFEVQWTRGSKVKSIYMRKPLHYMVYQLAIDIEAQTGIKADRQLLTVDGDELQQLQRLGNCLLHADVVVVKQQQAAQLQLSKLKQAEQLLAGLMPRGSELAAVSEAEDDWLAAITE